MAERSFSITELNPHELEIIWSVIGEYIWIGLGCYTSGIYINGLILNFI
jgi:hypothetical protein